MTSTVLTDNFAYIEFAFKNLMLNILNYDKYSSGLNDMGFAMTTPVSNEK